MNGSKPSSNLIFSYFVFQCNVDVLVSFKTPNFGTFSKDFISCIYVQSWCCILMTIHKHILGSFLNKEANTPIVKLRRLRLIQLKRLLKTGKYSKTMQKKCASTGGKRYRGPETCMAKMG